MWEQWNNLQKILKVTVSTFLSLKRNVQATKEVLPFLSPLFLHSLSSFMQLYGTHPPASSCSLQTVLLLARRNCHVRLNKCLVQDGQQADSGEDLRKLFLVFYEINFVFLKEKNTNLKRGTAYFSGVPLPNEMEWIKLIIPLLFSAIFPYLLHNLCCSSSF